MSKIIEVGKEEIVWEYQESRSKWMPYESSASELLEKEYQANPQASFSISIGNSRYRIDFATMYQENESSYLQRVIRRQKKILNPKKVVIDELLTLFDTYKSKDGNGEFCIQGESILTFCQDLQIDPMGLDLLILFWKLGCTKAYCITQDQFIIGLASCRMETATKIKERISKMPSYIINPKDFKQFYSWCFDYMKPESSSKRIPLESAIALWKLTLAKYPYAKEWCEFMESGHYKEKTIIKDIYMEVFNFMTDPVVNEDLLHNYDSNQAFPVIIDDFVDWLRAKQNNK